MMSPLYVLLLVVVLSLIEYVASCGSRPATCGPSCTPPDYDPSYGPCNCPSSSQSISWSCSDPSCGCVGATPASQGCSCPVGQASCSAGAVNCPSSSQAVSCSCDTNSYSYCNGMISSQPYTCPVGTASCSYGTCNCATGTMPAYCSCDTNSYSYCNGMVSSVGCSCPSNWNYGSWGSCDQACGPGTQYRSVWCTYSDGQASGNCGASPPTSQSCNNGNCVWLTGGWSGCSTSCGPGTQTRSVFCSGSTCPGGAPASSQSCSPTNPDCVAWYAGPWSACPSCGAAATQSRTVYCQDTSYGGVGSGCVGAAPISTQSCGLPDCYAWTQSGWNSCSATCGPGIQTQVVQCIDTSTGNNVVADSYCTTYVGAKPATQQNCDVIHCFAWQNDPSWGACSVTCSHGTQTRNVWCEDTTATTVAGNGNCAGAAPISIQACYTPCTDDNLMAMGVTALPSFASTFTPSTVNYWVTIPYAFSSTTVTGTVEDSTATIVWNPACQCVSGLLWPTYVPVTATVTAQGGQVKVYTINIQRAKSTISTLNAFTPSTGVITPSFTPGTTSYTLTVPNTVTSLSMSSVLTDSTASENWGGVGTSASLPVGPTTTTFTDTVTSQDGNYVTIYTLVVTRTRSSVDTLAALTIVPQPSSSAHMKPVFSTGNQAYSLTGYLGPTMNAVLVTATVTVIVADSAPTMTYTMQSGTSGVLNSGSPTLIGVPIGVNDLQILVTAQDGSTLLYACTIHRVSPISSLASITWPAGGTLTTGFSSTTYSYTVNIPATYSTVSFIAIPTSPFAALSYSLQGGGLVTFTTGSTVSGLVLSSSGDVQLQIEIQSEDLTSTTPYNFILHHISSVSTLQSLVSAQGTMAMPTTLTYHLNLIASVTTVQLTATPTSTYATMTYQLDGGSVTALPVATQTTISSSLSFGDHTVLLVITAEDMVTTTTVTLTVHRMSNVATLNNLVPMVGSLDQTFTSGTHAYTTTVGSGVGMYSILPTASTGYTVLSYTFGSNGVVTPLPLGQSITGLPLVVGLQTLTILSSSEDTQSTITYTVTIRRQSGVATLNALSIADGSQLSPPFDSSISFYNVVVPSAVGSLSLSQVRTTSVTAILEFASGPTSSYSSVTWSGSSNAGVNSPSLTLTTGSANYIFVRHTSEDGSVVLVTTVAIRRLSGVSTLSALSTNSGVALSPAFSPTQTTYSIIVPNTVTTISISFTTTDPSAVSSYIWKSGGTFLTTSPITNLNLTIGINILALIVASEDAVSQTDIALTIHRLSSDATLTGVAVDDSVLTPPFASNIFAYTIPVSASKATASIIALATAPSTTTLSISIDGGSTWTGISSSVPWSLPAGFLTVGPNMVKIRSVAEDHLTTLITVLTIRRLSDVATLSGLTAASSSTITPAFTSTTLEYTLTFPSSVTSTTVTLTPSYPSASMQFAISGAGATVNQLTPTTGIVPLPFTDAQMTRMQVVVTSEDGSQVRIYQVTFEPTSTVSTLSHVIQSSLSFTPAFDPAVLSYNLSLANYLTTMQLTPFTTDVRATLMYASTLGSLVVPSNGVHIPITSGSAILVSSLPVGDSLLSIIVTAQDTSYTSQYIFHLNRVGTDARLFGLTLTGGSISPIFSQTTYAYTMQVAPGITSTTVNAVSNSIASSILFTSTTTFTPVPIVSLFNFAPHSVGTATAQLVTGDQTITVTVLAQDQSTKLKYSITIHRVSDDASLKSLVLRPSLGGFTFDPTVMTYNLSVPSIVNSLTLIGVPASTLAKSMNGTFNTAPVTFTAGFASSSLVLLPSTIAPDQIITVTVMAEDGITQIMYTLNLHLLNSDSSLTSLVVTSPNVPITFSRTQLSYSASVSTSVTSFVITAVSGYHAATMVYQFSVMGVAIGAPIGLLSGVASDPLPLPVGSTILSITVTSEDSQVSPTPPTVYQIVIERISADASIVALMIDPPGEGFVPVFDASSNVTDYTVRVPFSQTSITIAVLTSSSLATVSLSTLSLVDSTTTFIQPLNVGGVASSPQPVPVHLSAYSITIIAEDGVTTDQYTITVNRLSNEAAVASINVTAAGGLSLAGSLAFSSGQLNYAASVPNSANTLVLSAIPLDSHATLAWSFDTTTSLLNGITAVLVPLATNVNTPIITLVPGVNQIKLYSTSEDLSTTRIYTFVITRASDLTAINLQTLPQSISISTTPVWTPGQPVIVSTLPFRSEAICVDATFGTASPTWYVTDNNSADSVALVSASCSNPLALVANSLNEFTLNDPIDPVVINVLVTRGGPVVSSILLIVDPTMNPGAFVQPADFDSFTRAYVGDVPFITTSITVRVDYSAGSVTINGVTLVASGTGMLIPLTQGINTIVLEHSLDGFYTYIITRHAQVVTSLIVNGVEAGTGAIIPIVFSPVFGNGLLSFTTAVPNAIRAIELTAVFTGTLTDSPSGTGLVSNVVTTPVALAVGPQTFTLISDLDGIYQLVVVQGAIDVGGLTLEGVEFDGSLTPHSLTPNFVPGFLDNRVLTVPKATRSIAVTALFGTVGSVTIQLLTSPSGTLIHQEVLLSSQRSSHIPLAVGDNYFQLVSTQDGVYPFVISRTQADIVSVSIQGVLRNGLLRTIELPWIVTQSTYTISLPYDVTALRVTTVFLTPTSLQLASPLTTLVTSTPVVVPLVVGTQLIELDSALDGTFTITTTRAPPDITAVIGPTVPFNSTIDTYAFSSPYVLTLQPMQISYQTGGSVSVTLNGQLLDASVVGSGTILPLPLVLGANTIVVTSTLDGSYSFAVLRLPMDASGLVLTGSLGSGVALFAPAVPTLLTPAFDSYHVNSYTLRVASVVEALHFNMLFGTGNTVTVTNTATPASPVTLVSGTPSMLLLLNPGDNTFIVNAQLDGAWTIVVTRVPVDLVDLHLASTLGTTLPLAQTALTTPTPTLQLGVVYSYAYTLPNVLASITIIVSYHTAVNTPHIQFGGNTITGTVSTKGVGPSLIYVSSFDLALPSATTSMAQITSALDAPISLSITRLAPALTSLVWSGFTLGKAQFFNRSQIVTLPTTQVIHSTTMSPTFQPGQLTGYSLSLPYSIRGVALTLGTTLAVRVSLDGVAMNDGLLSSERSTWLNLTVGTHSIVVDSQTDGSYVFSVSRAPISITDLQLDVGTQSVTGGCPTGAPRPCKISNPPISPTWIANLGNTDDMGVVGNPLLKATKPSSWVYYEVTVPFVTDVVRATATFPTIGSTTLTTRMGDESLTSGVPSSWLPLAVPMTGVTDTPVSIYLSLYFPSSEDGDYTRVLVNRRLPDLQGLTMVVDGVTCASSSGLLIGVPILTPDPFTQMTPLINTLHFSPLTPSYTVEVPYSVETISFTSRFGIQKSGNTVTLAYVIASTNTNTPFVQGIRSGQHLNQIELLVGVNVFTINSRDDGVFTIYLTRLPPSTSIVGLTGSDASLVTPFSWAPRFQPFVFDYKVELPSAINQIQFNVTSITQTDQLTLVNHLSSDSTVIGAFGTAVAISPQYTVTGQQSPDGLAHNSFTLLSLSDGCYAFDVNVVQAPILLSVKLDRAITYPNDLNQAVEALGATVAAGDATAFAAGLGQVHPLDSNTLAYTIDLDPPFIAGWLGPYVGHVSLEASKLRMHFEVASGTVSSGCTVNGFTFDLTGFGPQVIDGLPINVGDNTIRCFTDEGTYIFQIRQNAFDWTRFDLPSTLYSTQLIEGLSITPIGNSLTDLTIHVWSSALPGSDSIVPSQVTLTGSGASIAPSFAYTAPQVSVPSIVYLSYLTSGIDATYFPPPWFTRVDILPQSSLRISGVAWAHTYYSLQTTDDLYLEVVDSVNPGSWLVVTITLVDDGSGIAAPVAVLNFSDSVRVLTFTLHAPLTQQTKPVHLTFALSGSDYWHYQPIPSVALTILPQSDFHLLSLPSTLYVSKSTSLSLVPSQRTNSTVQVTVEIVPPVGLLSSVDPTAIVTKSLTSLKIVLIFPAFSSAAVPFVYTAPMQEELGGAATLVISLEMYSVGDSGHYLALPTPTLTLLAAPALAWINIPASLLNRASSSGMTLTLPRTPLNDLTATFLSTDPDVTFDPPSIIFRSSSSPADLQASVRLNTPHWFKQNHTLTVDVVLSGGDADMFASPPEISIELMPQPPSVTSVTFFGRGSDGHVMTFSAGLTPFIGQFFDYYFDIAVAVMTRNAAHTNGLTTPVTPSGGRRLLASDNQIANLSVSIQAYYDETDHLTLDVEYTGVNAGNIQTVSLPNGVRSDWFDMHPGLQQFRLNSLLDGPAPYSFNFSMSLITDPTACLQQTLSPTSLSSNMTGTGVGAPVGILQYGLATQSFISPHPGQLPPDVTPISNSPPLLICATIPNLADQMQADAIANAPSTATTLQFTTSSMPSVSWIWLLLVFTYICIGLGSAITLGMKQVLTDEEMPASKRFLAQAALKLNEHQQKITNKLKQVPAPLINNLPSTAPQSEQRSTEQLSDTQQDSTISPKRDGRHSGSGSGSGSGSAVQLPGSQTQLHSSEASNANVSTSVLTEPNAGTPTRSRFWLHLSSLPMVVLVLCLTRAFSCVVFYRLYTYMSITVVRVCTGLPYVLMFIVIVRMASELRRIIRPEVELDGPADNANTKRFNLEKITIISTGVLYILLYAGLLGAQLSPNLENLIGSVMVGVLAGGCIGILAYQFLRLSRLMQQVTQHSRLVIDAPTTSSGPVTARVGRYLPSSGSLGGRAPIVNPFIGSALNDGVPHPESEVGQVRRSLANAVKCAMLFRLTSGILLIANIILIAQSSQSSLTSSSYQPWVLVFSAFECIALIFLALLLHTSVKHHRTFLLHSTTDRANLLHNILQTSGIRPGPRSDKHHLLAGQIGSGSEIDTSNRRSSISHSCSSIERSESRGDAQMVGSLVPGSHVPTPFGVTETKPNSPSSHRYRWQSSPTLTITSNRSRTDVIIGNDSTSPLTTPSLGGRVMELLASSSSTPIWMTNPTMLQLSKDQSQDTQTGPMLHIPTDNITIMNQPID